MPLIFAIQPNPETRTICYYANDVLANSCRRQICESTEFTSEIVMQVGTLTTVPLSASILRLLFLMHIDFVYYFIKNGINSSIFKQFVYA